MATGKLAVFGLVIGVIAIGVFALPLLADDDKHHHEHAAEERAEHAAEMAKISRILAKTDLKAAIDAAEKAAKGRAFAAELELEGSQFFYEVTVLTTGDKPRVMEVMVNTIDGRVVRVEEEDWDEDEGHHEDDEGHDDDEDDHHGKSGKSGKSEHSGKSGKSGKSERSDKSGKSEDSDKSDKSEKSETPGGDDGEE